MPPQKVGSLCGRLQDTTKGGQAEETTEDTGTFTICRSQVGPQPGKEGAPGKSGAELRGSSADGETWRRPGKAQAAAPVRVQRERGDVDREAWWESKTSSK